MGLRQKAACLANWIWVHNRLIQSKLPMSLSCWAASDPSRRVGNPQRHPSCFGNLPDVKLTHEHILCHSSLHFFLFLSYLPGWQSMLCYFCFRPGHHKIAALFKTCFSHSRCLEECLVQCGDHLLLDWLFLFSLLCLLSSSSSPFCFLLIFARLTVCAQLLLFLTQAFVRLPTQVFSTKQAYAVE